MAKIFNIPLDQIGTAKPLPEDVWFKLFQPLLLQIVNTEYGRDLLCVPREHPEIIEFAKNFVRWKDGENTVTEFRIGAKWANVIRYRWPEFKAFAKRFYEKEIYGQTVLIPVLKYRGEMVAAGTTSTFYPEAGVEVASVDGNARREGVDVAFATLRAGAGTAASDSEQELTSPYLAASATTDQFQRLIRSFFLFDTSAISDTDVISAATLSVDGDTDFTGVTKDNDIGDPDFHIVASAPASNTALVAADFQTVSFTSFGSVAYASWGDPYNDITLNASGIANISKTGTSKFAGILSWDLNDSFTGTWSGSATSYFAVEYAENTGTSLDPKLVVVHAAGADIAASRRIIVTT